MNHTIDVDRLNTDAPYCEMIRQLASRGDTDARTALRTRRYAAATVARATGQLTDGSLRGQAAAGLEAAARRFGTSLPDVPDARDVVLGVNADPAGSGDPAGQPHTPAPTEPSSAAALVTAAFHSVGAGRFTAEQLAALAEDADPSRYLTALGDVDVDRIASKLDRLSARGRADLGQGRGQALHESKAEQGRAAAAARFGPGTATRRPQRGAPDGRVTAEHDRRSRTPDPRRPSS